MSDVSEAVQDAAVGHVRRSLDRVKYLEGLRIDCRMSVQLFGVVLDRVDAVHREPRSRGYGLADVVDLLGSGNLTRVGL